ncbi:MAG: gamma-glutamyltransferase [Rhodospirillales bacterium]|nr:gamma-glutamyltransferase [Rhodospirillales bacterium]
MSLPNAKGAVAAGHPETVRAAAAILEEGGNAFDAILAGMFAACAAEPVLASLGGGGFLLARPATGVPGSGAAVLYDFFAQTPKQRDRSKTPDFYPILADFGTAQQEFHIGMGSIATPGIVKGAFEVHADLCSLPMQRIVEPAVVLSREGFLINKLQAYIFDIVGKIYLSSPESLNIFESSKAPGQLIGEGERMVMPAYADTLEALAGEGADLFYRGDIGQAIVEACRTGGGYLTAADLEGYEVIRRSPLSLDYNGTRIWTNPPPSTGGILIAFALELLKDRGLGKEAFGSAGHLLALASAMRETNKARVDSRLHEARDSAAETLLNAEFLEAYRRNIAGHPLAQRGTTHLSVIDGDGNAASLTLSNGEGAGYVVPGTAVMLNNMLGEEDINPHGFHQWPEDVRMSSMMAPSLIMTADGETVALGSGGSNRIRTAILQVILNHLEFGLSVEESVSAPRIHYEGGLLSVEPGFDEADIGGLSLGFPDIERWDDKNLFFGGVHSVLYDPRRQDFHGAGDLRRGGVAEIL